MVIYYEQCDGFGITKIHLHVLTRVVNDLNLPKLFSMNVTYLVKSSKPRVSKIQWVHFIPLPDYLICYDGERDIVDVKTILCEICLCKYKVE